MFNFHHTCISVSDFEKSLKFYEQIGFTSTFYWQADDCSIKLGFLKNNNQLIELLYYADFTKGKPKTVIQSIKSIGLCHIALSVGNIEIAKAKLEQMLDKTFEIEEVGAYFKHFFIQDPDNNYVEIIEDQYHAFLKVKKNMIVMLKPDFKENQVIDIETKHDLLTLLYSVIFGSIEKATFFDVKYKKITEELVFEFSENMKKVEGCSTILKKIKKELKNIRSISMIDFLNLSMKITGFTALNKPVSTRLNEAEIRYLFPILNKDSIHGEEWKTNVIKALQEGDVKFIEYETKKTITYRAIFPSLIKKMLRNSMIEDFVTDRLSYNLIHTPDEHEVNKTLIFFHSKIKSA